MHLLIEIQASETKSYAVLETGKYPDLRVGDRYNFLDGTTKCNQTGKIIKRSDNKPYLLARKRCLEEITNKSEEPNAFENTIAVKKSRYSQHLLRCMELLAHEKYLLEEIEMLESAEKFNSYDKTIEIDANEIKMVEIGSRGTLVKKSKFDRIQWTSCSKATRGLLMALFTREELGTHSMTGKRSAAHPDKPPKEQLDPLIIEDIVSTVSVRCKVSASQVRNAITSKCADENKRRRQQPPSDSSGNTDDDSY